jgi:hypothetical protein
MRRCCLAAFVDMAAFGLRHVVAFVVENDEDEADNNSPSVGLARERSSAELPISLDRSGGDSQTTRRTGASKTALYFVAFDFELAMKLFTLISP